MKKILDVGGGIHPVENADIIDFSGNPTYKHNLNIFPYPIENKTYDVIYCNHTLEHLDDITKVLYEFKRILKDDGEIIIKVPYLTSNFAFECPDHKHYFTFFTLDFYVTNPASHLELWFFPQFLTMKSKKLIFVKGGIRFYNHFFEWFANNHPIHYENLLKYIFPAREIEVHMTK